MNGIHRRQLRDGTDVIWAVPLSGMGHVADEQPLPYLQQHGIELTPRFGGEEHLAESGTNSLPLPYGLLATQWPWRQRIFNLSRRRINIYWRNIFRDATRKDGLFHFLEQLKYRETHEGYTGQSPLLHFHRTFTLEACTIKVDDTLEFKDHLHFTEIYLCQWAEFQVPETGPRCRIQTSLAPNQTRSIKSSTGTATWHAHKLSNAQFARGDRVSWSYIYQVE